MEINNYQPNGGNPKKRKIIIFISAFVAVIFAVGIGILAAELKIRKDGFNKQIFATVVQEQEIPEVKTDPVVGSEESQNSAEVQPVENQEAQELKTTFAVIGDTQRFEAGNNAGGFQKAVSQIKKQNIDLAVAIGDIVSSCDRKNGCEGKLNDWKNVLGPLFSKTYVTMGNHDRTGDENADELFQKFFSFPTNGPSGFGEFTYSFDLNDSHFVFLDSAKPREHVINKTQRDWLEKDLSVNKLENTFVFYHEPAYPVSSKIDESLDAESGERDALWNIFTRYKITAAFSGHEHIASRKKIGGIYQFVFGNTDSYDHDLPKPGMAEYAYQGQSFGIVEINGKSITVKTLSVDGKILDTFTLIK